MGKTHLSGQLVETGSVNSQRAARTEDVRNCTLFIPPGAATHLPGAAITTVFTRTAAGDYHIARSAAAGGAETDSIIVPIGGALFAGADTVDTQRGERTRGARINTLEAVYRVLVVNLTSLTPSLNSAAYTDAAAKVITNSVVTPTVGAAGDISFHATNMQRFTITPTVPLIVTPAMDVTLDLQVVLANTGDFEWHGLYVNYDILL
jgi:hypothetical protein